MSNLRKLSHIAPFWGKEAIPLIERGVREIHETSCQERDPRAGPRRRRITLPGTGAIVVDATRAPGLGSKAAPKFRGAELPGLVPTNERSSGTGLVY